MTLGCLFFLISLILAILIGRSNRVEGLDTKTANSGDALVAPAIPGEVTLPEIGDEEEDLLKALEQGLNNESANEAEPTAVEGEPSDAVIIEEQQ